MYRYIQSLNKEKVDRVSECFMESSYFSIITDLHYLSVKHIHYSTYIKLLFFLVPELYEQL